MILNHLVGCKPCDNTSIRRSSGYHLAKLVSGIRRILVELYHVTNRLDGIDDIVAVDCGGITGYSLFGNGIGDLAAFSVKLVGLEGVGPLAIITGADGPGGCFYVPVHQLDRNGFRPLASSIAIVLPGFFTADRDPGNGGSGLSGKIVLCSAALIQVFRLRDRVDQRLTLVLSVDCILVYNRSFGPLLQGRNSNGVTIEPHTISTLFNVECTNTGRSIICGPFACGFPGCHGIRQCELLQLNISGILDHDGVGQFRTSLDIGCGANALVHRESRLRGFRELEVDLENSGVSHCSLSNNCSLYCTLLFIKLIISSTSRYRNTIAWSFVRVRNLHCSGCKVIHGGIASHSILASVTLRPHTILIVELHLILRFLNFPLGIEDGVLANSDINTRSVHVPRAVCRSVPAKESEGHILGVV